MSLWRNLGLALDTWGGRARMQRFRDRPAAEDVAFHRTGLVQYRYRERSGPTPDSPTIVFAADPPATVEFYDEVLDVFGSHFRVVVFELPAMGFSATEGRYRFGFRETNDDVADFLRAVAGEGAVLAFSCVATLAALDIAARYPELVSHLILIQGGSVEAFDRWKAARDPKGILAKPVVGQMIMKRIAPERMPAWYHISTGSRERMPEFCACAKHTLEDGALWSLASAYQVYMDPGVVLPSPTQPVLGIWGVADGSHPEGNAELCEGVMGGDFVRLEGLGHAPEVEAPDEVLPFVLDFLEAN